MSHYWKQETKARNQNIRTSSVPSTFQKWALLEVIFTPKIIFTWILSGLTCIILTVEWLEGNSSSGALRHLHCTVGSKHIGMQFRLSTPFHRGLKILWIEVMWPCISMGQRNNSSLQWTFKLHENIMLVLRKHKGCQEYFGSEGRTKWRMPFCHLYIHGEYWVHLWSPHLHKGIAEGEEPQQGATRII